MQENPTDIALQLVQQHGRDGALREATRQGLDAQTEARLYDLSIWREVKTYLRELREEPPS